MESVGKGWSSASGPYLSASRLPEKSCQWPIKQADIKILYLRVYVDPISSTAKQQL
ncbi:MAG: hypothetical protein JWR09_5335 [Mucilaginibacter sp.]|nr:hypothetical protein [Mucilaginibacter sp.]